MPNVRQYIGARYVIKVYENTLLPSSAEWQAGVTYEPLTMVTYNNSSYLSKKDVPAAIGDPASNPSYWVVTGAYNGQILNLQNQIDAINAILTTHGNDISDLFSLVNKNVVLITDSYGQVQSAAFPFGFATACGKTLGTDYFYSAAGGSGFMNGTKTFEDQLRDLEPSIPDDDLITDIIVLGGVNDGSYSNADIQNAMSSFRTYAVSTFPNAKIHVGFISRYKDDNSIYTMYNTVLRAYKNGAMSIPRMSFIETSPVWLPYEGIDTDGLHPTAAGCNYLAWELSNYVIGGNGVYYLRHEWVGTFDVAGITITSPNELRFIADYDLHGFYDCSIGRTLFACSGMQANAFRNGLKICSITNNFIKSVSYDTGALKGSIMVRINTNGTPTYYTVPASIKLEFDGVYLRFLPPYGLENEDLSIIWFTEGFNGFINPMQA